MSEELEREYGNNPLPPPREPAPVEERGNNPLPPPPQESPPPAPDAGDGE